MELDRGLERIEGGEVEAGMSLLIEGTAARRAASSPEAWRAFVLEEARGHPVRRLLEEDPLTRIAGGRGSATAGADLLDYVYGVADPRPLAASERGARILEHNLATPTARALRHRRRQAAAAIDRVAAERPGARVLALACGRLREAELSAALATGAVGELVAFERDEARLEVVRRDYGHLPVEIHCGSVGQLLARRERFRDFDLVYAAGIFDDLTRWTGQWLAAEMFRSLRPGGTMLLANFAESASGAGYLEAFMDRFLVYRSDDEILALLSEVPPVEIARLALSHDPDRQVAYLEVRRVP